jgi:hypothetical protein
MRDTHFAVTVCAAAVLLVASGFALGASGAAPATRTGGVPEVSKLLRGMAADARAVEVHAREVENLAGRPAPTFQAYDKHWNEIKPKVEDITHKFQRLENMRASALPSQQQAIDRSAPLINQISSETEKLRAFLDQHSGDLSNPMFKISGQSLVRKAEQLVVAVRPIPAPSNAGKALGTK